MHRTTIAVLLLLFCLQLVATDAQSIQDSYLAEARGDYNNAILVMQNLAEKDPTEVFYMMRVAWLSYLMGNYQSALEQYQRSLRSLDHADARLGVINCQLALGLWDEVLSGTQAMLEQNPQNTLALSKAAYAAYMKKSYSLAADYFARIISISPWDMENRGYLVNNLYLSGNISEAGKQYRILKKYFPQSQIVIDYKDILDTQ
jgi:tetratricopeptide (TPR) repeat protein